MFNWKKEETAQNAIYLDKEMGGKGRQFKSRFLTPGLVKYDYGVCLLTKENADKFIQDFVGCPVIINHQDVTDENAKEISVGNIFSVWFDEKDGYYWCNGIITDKDAIKLIDKGYSVSCQYTITEYSDNNSGALHNGNPYDKIIENGRPEHLAIVNNPRYEGAIIAVNAINVSEKKEESEKEEVINENLTTDDKTASNSFVEEFKDTLYEVLAEGISNRLGELIATNWTKENFKEEDVLRDKGKFARRSEFSKETKDFTELENNYSQYFEEEPENYSIITEEEALKDLEITKDKPKIIKTPLGDRNVSVETIHHIYTREDKTRYKSINKMFLTLEKPIIVNKYNNKEYFFKVFKTDEYKNDITIVAPEENEFEVITNIPTDTLNWFYKKMQFGETIYDIKKAAID